MKILLLKEPKRGKKSRASEAILHDPGREGEGGNQTISTNGGIQETEERECQEDPYEKLLRENGFADVEFLAPLKTNLVNLQALLKAISNSQSGHTDHTEDLESVENYSGIIATSQKVALALRAVAALLPAKEESQSKSLFSYLSLPVYCVGPATQVAMQDLGFRHCRGGPECGNAESLATFIINEVGGQDEGKKRKPLLFLQGDKTRQVIGNLLGQAGITIRELQVYETSSSSLFTTKEGEMDGDDHFQLLEAMLGGRICILFSPSGLTALSSSSSTSVNDPNKFSSLKLCSSIWITIGPTSQAALREMAGIESVMAPTPSPQGVLSAIQSLSRTKGPNG